MKKIISVLLIITMLLGVTALVPLSVSATTDGVEGENIYVDEYGKWTYELTDSGDGCIITAYDQGMTNIEIPSSINGLPVLEIGDYAFNGYISLTSVTIPNSVVTIGMSAFENCSSLNSIDIPDSVTSINIFAFYNCKSITNVTIPESIVYIGKGVFSGCSSLANVEVSPNNKSYSSVKGVLFNKEQSELICYPAGKISDSYNIPYKTTAVNDYAFYRCNNLTEIKMSNEIVSVGDFSFFNCSSLNSVTLPSKLISIGDFAFYYCSSLAKIMIPNSVTVIGRYAFENCSTLAQVYYTGAKGEWDRISICNGNSYLEKATFYYNHTLPKLGDISGDGDLAVNDIIYLLKNIVDAQELTDEQLALADISGDGKLTVLDAILIQKLVLEML